MCSSVLVLTLLVAFDPVRLGITLLLISRPRPVQSLLAYWVGAMIVSVPYMLIPLTLPHVTPIFRSFAQGLAAPATFASPTVRHIQIGIGVVALSLAALMTAHFWARRRTQLPTPDGNTATLVPDSNKPTAISPLPGRAQNAPAEDESAIRRLLRRGHNAWESGSSWVALVIGLGSGPPPLTVLLVLTTVMASGAAIGAQVSAALAWIVGDVRGCRDHPRQLSGHASENPSGTATAPQLVFGSQSASRGSHVGRDLGRAGNPRHGPHPSSWLRAWLPSAAPVPG